MLTVAEAAVLLGISQRGVQDRLRRGLMNGRRVGQRVWLISRSEVERVRESPPARGRPRKEA